MKSYVKIRKVWGCSSGVECLSSICKVLASTSYIGNKQLQNKIKQRARLNIEIEIMRLFDMSVKEYNRWTPGELLEE